MLPNTDEKEKAIGGVLTFPQFIWLMVFAFLAALIGGSIFKITGSFILFIIIFIVFFSPSLLFAFYKKMNMSLFSYIVLKRKFSKKTKILLSINKEENKK